MRPVYPLLAFSLTVVGLAVACGLGDGSIFPDGEGPDGGETPLPPIGGGDSGLDPDGQAAPILIEPADPVVTFTTGQPAPTVQFRAKLVATGQEVPATFGIDRGEVGSIVAAGGLFTASGKVGGKASISATWNGRSVATSITAKLKISENGAPATPDAGGGGAGGNGGVGGEGPGAAVDPATAAVLKGTPVADPNLSLLYPYDQTVWPRGLLAPLLQWKLGGQPDFDAVLIKITENDFEYEGMFKKTAAPFIHHPITQSAWKALTNSNGGEEVTVSLAFARGGAAYGPVTVKWKVASAPLKGIVYYNSYGTNLAKNYTGALGGDGKFGGATLAIKGGSTDPTLVAGGNGDSTYCRVCHSVAANGSALITQRTEGEHRRFSAYDLTTSAQTTMSPEGATASFAWPAIYPDGSIFLGDSSAAVGSSSAPNKLYQMPAGAGPVTPTAIAMNGWPADFRAALPAFSPDGKKIAFTMYAGVTGADGRTLGFMDFDKATSTFGAPTTLLKPANAAHTAIFPAFLPTNDAVVFELETRYNTRDYGGTRSDGDKDAAADRGTRAELWWVNVNGQPPNAVPLAKLNGATYLPAGANGHGQDATVNYEPTVNPVPSGGYAWVVFTSRRMYGNVATINPFHSDPRNFDLTETPTPKKLWVAAIDLNAAPGTDPSHPAFYLPAQELLAGNSRGYWVVDPCKSDGNECETGDECCGGFCRPDPARGDKLVCNNKIATCAQEFEKCTVDADCCNSASIRCINGRCAVPSPR